MGKSLSNYLGNEGLKAGIFGRNLESGSLYSEPVKPKKYSPVRRALMAIPVALSILGAGGCKPYVIPEEPPAVSGSVNPTEGQVPVDLNIEVTATDVNDNIADYSAFADYNNNHEEDNGENIIPSQPVSINSTYHATTPGNYGIYGKSTDNAGNVGTKKLADVSLSDTPEPPIPVVDKVDFAGTVKDTEAESTARTIARFYDASDSNVVAGDYLDSDILKTVISDTGNISTTLNQAVEQLPSGIVVRTRQSSSDWNDGTSYVTTEKFPQGNVSAGTIWTVPYDSSLEYDFGLLDTLQKRIDYATHVGRENVWGVEDRINNDFLNFTSDGDGTVKIGEIDEINGNPYHGLKKWNRMGELSDTISHPTFKGIKISKSIPNWETIKPRIISRINSLNLPSILESQILEQDNPISEPGWGVVLYLPSGNPYTVLWDDNGIDGYVEGFISYLHNTAPEMIDHEIIYHGILASGGHSDGKSALGVDIPEIFLSMGKSSSTYPLDFTPANEKMSFIPRRFPGMKPLNEILSVN